MVSSFRTALKQALLSCAARWPSMVVVTPDLRNSLRLEEVDRSLGDRFVNVGICEANAVCLAAGFATMGLIPAVVGFSVFTVLKPFEQILQNVAYPKLNVKLIATHSGLSVGKDGVTHQAIEDIAVMRSVPNMCILCASDAVETKAAVTAAMLHDGPVYVRLGRDNAEPIYGDGPKVVELGGSDVLRAGKDVSILATGVMVKPALVAAEVLSRDGIECRVLNMYSLKPIDETAIVRCARETGSIVTVEDHSTIGGLGGAVCEVLAKSFPVPVEMVGLRDTFGESGTQDDLFRKYHMGVDDIVEGGRVAYRRRVAT